MKKSVINYDRNLIKYFTIELNYKDIQLKAGRFQTCPYDHITMVYDVHTFSIYCVKRLNVYQDLKIDTHILFKFVFEKKFYLCIANKNHHAENKKRDN